ncbi:MAG: hypothetical protein MMC33_006849 [Icmadophila ericetorum]|nr:hypothetical protein [Icmadophila ericetorum]
MFKFSVYQSIAFRNRIFHSVRFKSNSQEKYIPKVVTRKAQVIEPEPPNKFRRRLWITGALAVYSFTAYGVYLYKDLTREDGKTPNVPIDVSDRYDRIAKNFDLDVDLTEKITGINWLRSRMTKRAHGDVLEVCAGTGRNSPYYQLDKCKSVTMVDNSTEMLKIAKQHFHDTQPEYKKCKFISQSALKPIQPASESGFDTILQTMGLCSTPEPSELLVRLGSLVKPETGQILLLEHGRSYYDWLNRTLDKTAPAHADKYGCWWNRDIAKIVEDSGLEIVKIKRYHLGTTWWIELKPSKTAATSGEK